MQIAVLRETEPGEGRVALVPESVKKLIAAGAKVRVESGAGADAGATDQDYVTAGAEVVSGAAVLQEADVLACIHRPRTETVDALREGAVVIGFLRPLDDPGALEPVRARNLTSFAMELVPRITRAQAMDALSSQATVAGYKAAVMGADRVPRMFPLLMTAAGTVPPAKVLVLGAGVAGLQAIATARRLGAVVEGYDVRAAAGEQVRSLGAIFLEVDLGGIQTEDAGGYAKELTEEAMQRGRDLIAKHARTADVVITTAQVPGRRAPLLVTEDAVAGMKRGSIVIDLSGASGGNCALSAPGGEVERNGVLIVAPLNLPATVPVHASQLYSRNVAAFLGLLVKDGNLNIDLQDNVVGPCCVTHAGSWANQRVSEAVARAAQ
jgi:H+-translocating NAD(P) transhydrogenase subunit alpha